MRTSALTLVRVEDMQICGTEVTLEGNDVEGVWTKMVSGSAAVIEDPALANTLVTDLDPGENVFVWSIHSGGCGITSRDTVRVFSDLLPITAPDAYSTANLQEES